jgi:hypothetical protein
MLPATKAHSIMVAFKKQTLTEKILSLLNEPKVKKKERPAMKYGNDNEGRDFLGSLKIRIQQNIHKNAWKFRNECSMTISGHFFCQLHKYLTQN